MSWLRGSRRILTGPSFFSRRGPDYGPLRGRPLAGRHPRRPTAGAGVARLGIRRREGCRAGENPRWLLQPQRLLRRSGRHPATMPAGWSSGTSAGASTSKLRTSSWRGSAAHSGARLRGAHGTRRRLPGSGRGGRACPSSRGSTGPTGGPERRVIPKNMVGARPVERRVRLPRSCSRPPQSAHPGRDSRRPDRVRGTRATAILARTATGEQRVRAGSGGPGRGRVHVAWILQRSGIGPEDELARLGAPTVVPLPGVGQNLLEHPGHV